MTSANQILAAAMSLPPDARAQLAEQLLDSVDPAQSEIDSEWKVEIESRIREVEDGRAQLVPHDQAMAAARQHLRTKRAS